MQAVRSHDEGRDFEGGSKAQATAQRVVGSAAATKRVSLRVQTISTRYIQVFTPSYGIGTFLHVAYVAPRQDRHGRRNEYGAKVCARARAHVCVCVFLSFFTAGETFNFHSTAEYGDLLVVERRSHTWCIDSMHICRLRCGKKIAVELKQINIILTNLQNL